MKVWLCTTKTNDGATVDGAEIQRENQLVVEIPFLFFYIPGH